VAEQEFSSDFRCFSHRMVNAPEPPVLCANRRALVATTTFTRINKATDLIPASCRLLETLNPFTNVKDGTFRRRKLWAHSEKSVYLTREMTMKDRDTTFR
jgi:hypothetical protein